MRPRRLQGIQGQGRRLFRHARRGHQGRALALQIYLVLVDLKIGTFEPAATAQMQIYLEWTKRYDMHEGEADPVSLTLCGSKGQ
jgi:hypothetical protein